MSIDTARDTLAAALNRHATWTRKLAEATTALAEHENTSGDALVSDPEAFESMLDAGDRLRAAVAYADRAVQAAEAAIPTARAEVLAAAAADVERRRDDAQRELDAHRAEAEKLLSAFLEHEGGSGLRLADEWWHTTDAGSAESYVVPRSMNMAGVVRGRTDLAMKLRTVAADPTQHAQTAGLLATVYPGGPEAIAATERREKAAQAAADLEHRNSEMARLRSAVSDRIGAMSRHHPTRYLRVDGGYEGLIVAVVDVLNDTQKSVVPGSPSEAERRRTAEQVVADIAEEIQYEPDLEAVPDDLAVGA